MTNIRRRRAAALVLLALSAPGPAPAQEPPTGYDLTMEMTFLGWTVGRLRLQATIEPTEATTRLDLESIGFVRVLTGFVGWAEADAALLGPADVQALRFDTFYETNRATREVRLRYDPATGDIAQLETFKRGEPSEPDVPVEMRDGTIDPLSALFVMRDWTAAARDGGDKTIMLPMFDGRRRYDVEVTYLGKHDEEVGGRQQSTLALMLRLIPLAGFDEDDMLANWASKESGTWIRALITDDAALVPLLVETRGGFSLRTSIRTTEACLNTGVCTEYAF